MHCQTLSDILNDLPSVISNYWEPQLRAYNTIVSDPEAFKLELEDLFYIECEKLAHSELIAIGPNETEFSTLVFRSSPPYRTEPQDFIAFCVKYKNDISWLTHELSSLK